jgi:hypothetical protein
MFYIIGVSHDVQHKKLGAPDLPDHKTYRACLSNAIALFRPVLVAEEFNAEGHADNEFVTKTTANSFDVEHRFCDPDEEARIEIGCLRESDWIRHLFMYSEPRLSDEECRKQGHAKWIGKSWPPREQFWLDQLRDVVDKDVIFVCGNGHVENFIKLLTRNGIESTVTKRAIGVTPEEIADYQNTMAYLESHPELLD